MVLVFKQSLSVYRYSWVSGRGWPHLREWTCDDTPRENEEQANPEQKASGRKENKDCKKGQWVVENWEPGRKFSSPVERLSSAVLSKTLAISQRKDRSWAGSSRKTKTLFHWEAKVVDVRPSQKKVVFFLGSKSRRKLGEPEGWWYIQQEPWPRGLRDFEVRDKKEESLEEPMYWTRTTPRQGAVWGEWMTPPPSTACPWSPAWVSSLAPCCTRGTKARRGTCLGGREGARKLWSNVWTPAAETASLFPSSDSPNLMLAALPKQEAFASLFYPGWPACKHQSRSQNDFCAPQFIPSCIYFNIFFITKSVHSLCRTPHPDTCSESHFSLTPCSWV